MDVHQPDDPAALVGNETAEVLQLVTSIRVNLASCYSCGQPHQHVEAEAYKADATPWTHHYRCPTTGDPVPLAIVTRDSEPMEVTRRAVRELADAQHNGAYMVCVYSFRKGRLHLFRHTAGFPHAQFLPAADLLRTDLERELPAKDAKPLPPAKGFKLNLFGGEPQIVAGHFQPAEAATDEAGDAEPDDGHEAG
jgi:ribosomal protein S14